MTLNKFRTKELTWDKAGKQIDESIEANSGDSNGRKLVVQVLDGYEIADLTEAQLYLSWKSYTNKHKGLDAFKAVDLSKGIFEIAYTTEMLSNVGNLRASLVLIDKVGRVESKLFTITVSRSNVDDESVQSEDSFTALTEALIQINKYQSDIDGIKQDFVNESNQLIATEKAELDALQLDYANRAETLETTYAPRLNAVEDSVDSLQAFIGYTNDDIMGVEVDFKNKKFTRLAGAVNKTPGEMFDDVQAFGGRKRCILTDDGVVLAYHGEPGYTETGALTQAIVIELEPAQGEEPAVTETYEVGTKVQVMVEQPKFYYKVVPLQLDKVVDGKGFHMRKARYYVSDVKKTGFKLHPAFIHNGKEKNFIYLSAYEGSVYDKSASAYLLADEQIVDFAVDTGDLLSSIAYAKPTSGVTQTGATRDGFRKIANNRGTGWEQSYTATISATQLLFTIEYTSMNTQNAIGFGVAKTDDGSTNMAEPTGATTILGNTSGKAANGSVSYRGEENFWGNIWKWVDGLNIEAKGLHNLFVADHGFADDIGVDPYKDAGITLAKADGSVSAFAYNEEFDWLFFPSETLGNSSLPVGDSLWQNYEYNSWLVARLGGSWTYGSAAGGFCWYVYYASSNRSRGVGGRLVYVPKHL